MSKTLAPADCLDRVVDFCERALAQGFIPYAAFEDRDLDEVVVLSGETWSISQQPAERSDPDG